MITVLHDVSDDSNNASAVAGNPRSGRPGELDLPAIGKNVR